MPDLNVTLPGAGGKHGGQHRVEGGADAGLRMRRERPRPAGGAEAVQQDPAVRAARHQQVSVWGTLTAHRVAFYLQRGTRRVSSPPPTPAAAGPCTHLFLPAPAWWGHYAHSTEGRASSRAGCTASAPPRPAPGHSPTPSCEAGALLWTILPVRSVEPSGNTSAQLVTSGLPTITKSPATSTPVRQASVGTG